VSENVIAARFF